MKQWRKSSRFRKAYDKAYSARNIRNLIRLDRLQEGKKVFSKKTVKDFMEFDIYRVQFKLLDSIKKENPFIKFLNLKYPYIKTIRAVG